jgi:lipopolysaccharide/colanic/teichoic acid biosynthesis glycosyltransferase
LLVETKENWRYFNNCRRLPELFESQMSTQSKAQRRREVGETAPPCLAGNAAGFAPLAREAVAPFFAQDWRAIFLGTLRAADVAVIGGAGLASYAFRHGSLQVPALYWWSILAGCLLAAIALNYAAVYTFRSLRQRSHHLGWVALNLSSVGPHSAAEKLAQRIQRGSTGDLRLLGISRTTSDGGEGEGEVEALAKLAPNMRVHEILMALPCTEAEDVRKTLQRLGTLPTDVKLCLDFDGTTLGIASVLSTQPLLVCRRPLAGWRIVVKRSMDVVLSETLIFVFAPFMALLAALVKLDSSGPEIVRQERFGFNKQPFTVYRFRTVHCGIAAPSVPQARRSDPRVTRLGSMSLVGPRPHAVVHDEKYARVIDGYLKRHRVLPGITGWAQVNGFSGETDTTEKMARRSEHDLFYIDNWSALFDLRILARTLSVGFRDRNAY